MWPVLESKEAYLPVRRFEWGFCQSTRYVQADLYHEEVLELDSPFAAQVRSDTLSFKFLVLGDQNAGKSTFLHAWTFESDPSFLTLVSELPVLSSQFVNSRFILSPHASLEHARDELPFLDTDIARATVLLTTEDFVFWLRERQLHVPQILLDLHSPIMYCQLHFIEIGGDHLDRLMSEDGGGLPAEILSNSLQLIRSASSFIYFVNGSTTFSESVNESFEIRPENLTRLAARFNFLFRHLPPSPHALMCLSRPPAGAEASNLLTLLRNSVSSSLLQYGDAVRFSSVSILEPRTAVLSNTSSWPTLNAIAIMDLLYQLLGGESGAHLAYQVDSLHDSQLFASLLKCFLRLRKTSPNILWITDDVFSESLEHEHSLTVPPAQLLRSFLSGGAHRLAHLHHVLILHHENGLSSIRLRFIQNQRDVGWWENSDMSTRSSRVAVRLPVFPPLLLVISKFCAMNLPILLSTENSTVPSFIVSEINEATNALEDAVEEAWVRHVKFEEFVILLEDWIFAQRLMAKQAMQVVAFPRALPPSPGLTASLSVQHSCEESVPTVEIMLLDVVPTSNVCEV
jgi:hypothetical protein